jgi:hypothetical protein
MLPIRGGQFLDLIGLGKQKLFLATPRFHACVLPDATSSALATARRGNFHALLPHALQEQIDGSDGSYQQGNGYEQN